MVETLVQNGSGADYRAKMASIRETEKASGLSAAVKETIDFLHTQPEVYQGFVMLARLLTKQRRFDDARRAAERAKALAPLEAEPLIALGFIGLRRDEYSEASIAFAEAISLDPSSARAHLGAAAVKMHDENFDEARMLCDKVLELDPSMDRAHELKARILMRQGKPDDAVEDLQSMLIANPKNKRAVIAYVRLMRSQDKTDEALAFLEDNLALGENDRKGLHRLAQVAARAGKPEVAVEKYKPRATGDKARINDKIHYIMALTAASDFDTAEAEIAKLGDKPAHQAVAAKLRGDIAMKGDKPAEALALYKQACDTGRVPAPATDDPQADIAERAQLWKTHSRKGLLAAIKEKRAKAG
ncbi:MAG: tetratricopeptide repeat protein [Roseovarius sp.]